MAGMGWGSCLVLCSWGEGVEALGEMACGQS